jgi:phosphatidylserine decarboxylase
MRATGRLQLHQYIERGSGSIRTERLYGDPLLRRLYAAPWEHAPWLLHTLTSARMSQLLGFILYDLPVGHRAGGMGGFIRALDIDLRECLEPADQLDSPRKLFERKLRYAEVRPMADDPGTVVSPCDARVLVGSLAAESTLFLKGKFFELDELLGWQRAWREAFQDGCFAIFRLTPDKYHYNHAPVSGIVRERYEIAGCYHSCNPGPVVAVVTPYSKNARVLTIIDTDVLDGTGIGLVAMIEIAALMIGRIEQCYSDTGYDDPRPVDKGLFLRKGQPKSLYRPGSSTTVLLFQPDRIAFCEDLLRNRFRPGVESRFSSGFGRPLVETDLAVRSPIARNLRQPGGGVHAR